MENKNLNELWKTVLGEIQTEVSEANYLTLIKPTKLLSLEEGTATIATQSNIAINLLQKRFQSIIKKSLDKNTGQNINLSFIAKTLNAKKENQKENGPLFVENILKEAEEPKTTNVNSLARQLQRVRTDYTFETLAVSSSNQLAFVSAQTVAKNLGQSYNPLFIYGPVGVGKTHLMQAIANEVFKKDSEKKIIYTTSEEFTNEVVEAIRSNDTARMKRKFRNVSLLIIDDIQFVAGKDRVQEELFHTFNILIDNSSQIVLSSDRPPDEIKKLEKRLSSRFASGLTVDIEAPDFELRTAILLIKAKKFGVSLPIEAAKAMAEKTQDVRALEGTLLRIITEARTKNVEISIDLVESVFSNKTFSDKEIVHPDELVKITCQFYNIKPTQLKGPKRDASLVKARQVAMYLLKYELKLTLVEIGNILGGRDHTTIMHGIEKIEKIVSSTQNNRSGVSLEIMGITKQLFGQKGDY